MVAKALRYAYDDIASLAEALGDGPNQSLKCRIAQRIPGFYFDASTRFRSRTGR